MNEKNQHIIEVVIDSIKDGSIDGLSMSKIASLANVGKSTIYEFYTSKEELILIALSHMVDFYLARIMACPIENVSAYSAFSSHLNVVIDICNDCVRFHDIIFRNSSLSLNVNGTKEFLQSRAKLLFDRFKVIVALIGKEEAINTTVMDKDFYGILGMMYGIMSLYSNGSFVEQRDKLINDIYTKTLILLKSN